MYIMRSPMQLHLTILTYKLRETKGEIAHVKESYIIPTYKLL